MHYKLPGDVHTSRKRIFLLLIVFESVRPNDTPSTSPLPHATQATRVLLVEPAGFVLALFLHTHKADYRTAVQVEPKSSQYCTSEPIQKIQHALLYTNVVGGALQYTVRVSSRVKRLMCVCTRMCACLRVSRDGTQQVGKTNEIHPRVIRKQTSNRNPTKSCRNARQC